MKKKQKNTLGSWIDQSEMQRLTQALAPDENESEGVSTGEVSGIGLPRQSLNIDQATAYRAAPFPEPALPTQQVNITGPAEESVGGLAPVMSPDQAEAEVRTAEGPVLRAARALAEVRLRAEENGFLKRRHLKSAQLEPQAAEITAIPPVLAPVSGRFENQQGKQDESHDESYGVFELPQGPLRVRLDAFADWAMHMAEASRIVIVDGQGYSLLHRDLGEGGNEGGTAIVDSAMRLTSVLEQVQARTDFARDGAINLPLEEGGWLGVLRCENAGGRLCIAVVTPSPLEVEKSAAMKNELARTMEAGKH